MGQVEKSLLPDLQALRLNRGLSIEAAAAEIGVSGPTLRRAEGGERPYPRTAFKIASFYSLQVTDVWPLDRPEAA